jgi:hypothetical protein
MKPKTPPRKPTIWVRVKKIISTGEKKNGKRKEVYCSCGKRVSLPVTELSGSSKK